MIASLSFSESLDCDFEDFDSCGWQDVTTDDFDWTERTGSTPSTDTGPSSGYGGKNKYTEAILVCTNETN